MLGKLLIQTNQIKQGVRLTSSLVSGFENMVNDLPLREAVRYTNGNLKVSASTFKKWTDSHANALLEMGIKQGDSIIVWFPECAEKHVAMLTAAKIGAKVIELDPAVDSISAIRKALEASKCRVVIFDHDKTVETPGNDKLLLLRKAIPEFYHYDDSYGQTFHSKHFPELQYFIHTGFDGEQGALQYKTLFVDDAVGNPISKHSAQHTADETPLYTKMTQNGDSIKIESEMTHKQVLESKAWPFLDQLVRKEYFEC